MGDEYFKLAQGGKKRKVCVLWKKSNKSLWIKKIPAAYAPREDITSGRVHPSLPPSSRHTHTASGCRWSLPLHSNSCKPWLQTHPASLTSCEKLPPSSVPWMQALASLTMGRGDAKAPGASKCLECAHHSSSGPHHCPMWSMWWSLTCWGFRKKRGGWFTSQVSRDITDPRESQAHPQGLDMNALTVLPKETYFK